MSAEEVKGEEVVGDEEVKMDPTNPDVVTKYNKAGEIANLALAEVAKACVDGAVISSICRIGDELISAKTGDVYKKDKKMEKGIGFPTCVSVNAICGHFSPLDETEAVLVAGDVVKIDLGVQLDGFTATAATTIYIKKEGETKVTGKVADLLLATQTCADAAIRLLKAGNKNSQITEAITKIAEDFGCSPLIGVLSHNMDRFKIDGDVVIINKEDEENKVKESTFEVNQVFGLDIVLSTGEGKGQQSDHRTTVYRRVADKTYRLKMKASRETLSEIKDKYPSHPFSMARLENQKIVKIALKECIEHGLVTDYPVVKEKEGEFVAQVKVTALITEGRTLMISSSPIVTADCESEKKSNRCCFN